MSPSNAPVAALRGGSSPVEARASVLAGPTACGLRGSHWPRDVLAACQRHVGPDLRDLVAPCRYKLAPLLRRE
jgi:hypothetical protein